MGIAMSVFLVASAVAATASMIVTACIAYILVSFRLNGHLLASRTGRQPPALVLVAAKSARRRQSPKAPSFAIRQPRWQPVS
jgi:hypothetical protein